MTTRVVLLGGGYVTLHAYRQLVRRLGHRVRRGDVEIVVVSASAHHSFHGFTGEAVAGILPADRTLTPLHEICPRARIVHARVTRVDTGRRVVAYEPVGDGAAGEVAYDHLVVGTGAREPAAAIPGLAEHGYLLRGPGEIIELSGRVAQLATAPAGELGRRSVVVAGGGLAGVELAAAIADLGRGAIHVDLVHSGVALLPELRRTQPRLARRAERELHRLGVRVRLQARIVEVTARGARLSDGTVLASQTVVGAVGQRPVALPGLGDCLRDGRGRLVTAPDLSVTHAVWAAGDAARVSHVTSGDPVPANALWAIKGGAHVGANVARAILGNPTMPFRYRGLGQAASFGLGNSIAELYGVPFTGGVAWLLRLVFFLRFMPSRHRAALVVRDLAGAIADRRPGPDHVLAPTAAALDLAERRHAAVSRQRQRQRQRLARTS